MASPRSHLIVGDGLAVADVDLVPRLAMIPQQGDEEVAIVSCTVGGRGRVASHEHQVPTPRPRPGRHSSSPQHAWEREMFVAHRAQTDKQGRVRRGLSGGARLGAHVTGAARRGAWVPPTW